MSEAPIYIVLNAVSGSSETEATCRAITEVLTEAGRTHEILRVEDPTRLVEIAAQAVSKAKYNNGIVVAAGGDGTLSTVAQATLGSGCPFGVIPQGTFNYFGRTHGIPSDAAEATRALLDAHVSAVQVGLMNDRLFLVNASIGLHPQSIDDREEHNRRYGRSRFGALWAALVTIFRGYRPTRIRLEHEGRTRDLRTLTLLVSNNRLQLEQIGFEAAEAVDDGKLVAIILRPVPIHTLLWLVVQGAMSNLASARGVQHFSFSTLTVTPSSRRVRHMRVATDGETDWIDAPIVFRVAPEPLLLLKPVEVVPEIAVE